MDFNIELKFIDYASLIRAIRQEKFATITWADHGKNPWYQEFVKSILSDSKNHQAIKEILMRKMTPRKQQ